MSRVKHGTLVSDVVTTELVRGTGLVEVLNVDGADAIYFRVDGEDPEVGGEDCDVIPAHVGSVTVPVRHEFSNQTKVKLISSGAPKYAIAAR